MTYLFVGAFNAAWNELVTIVLCWGTDTSHTTTITAHSPSLNYAKKLTYPFTII